MIAAGTVFNAIMAVALLLLAWGFAQFVVFYRWGCAELEAARRTPRLPSAGYRLAVLIPALNEEAVIADTVRAVLALAPDATVLVVDDDSDDRTGMLAAAAGARVIHRDPEVARQGKGAALNAGYAELRRRAGDHQRTIVCVLDADDGCRPTRSQRCWRGSTIPTWAASSCRADPQPPPLPGPHAGSRVLGHVRHRADGPHPHPLRVARRQRQFTRLAALEQVGDQALVDALTEDLDLGLELTLLGWELDCAADTWVSQQGLESTRGLLRQRTRWYQGHMICARKTMQLWRSPRVARRTALETTLYLMTPCFMLLPWSIAFTLGLLYFAHNLIPTARCHSMASACTRCSTASSGTC